MPTALPVRFLARVVAGLGCSWLGFTGNAQSNSTVRVTPTSTNSTITIDGILNEDAWSQATSIQNFLGFEPAQGADHPGVDAKFLFDDDAIYVGWRIHQTAANGPKQLNAPLAPRDITLRHDWVGIVLDTFQDERRAFVFRSTARGVQADGIYVEGDSHLWMQDLSWDGVFDSAGVVHKVGSQESPNGEAVYTVELTIPFRSLRYPATPAQEWGVVLVHFTPKPWGIYTWPYLSKDQSGVLTQAATLGPFEAPPPKPQIEVLPTLTALSGDLINPSDDDSLSVEPGVSARIGITSSLTADLTVNPDFSQIEADEDQVTANVKFPLYYKEKRPFFLESSDLFQTPIEAFYSRSIVDPLAGTKVTGRAGRVGMGVVSAHDQTPAPSSISTDYATGESLDGWGDDEVEDATATVNVGRSQADMGNGNSVGMLFADKELWTTQQGRLANRVVGVDAVGRVGEHHMFTGQILGSQTDLCDGGMLMGPAWDFGWDRSGQIFTAELHHGFVSNEFRSETGFIEEVGRISTEGEVDWRLEKVGNFRFLGPGMDAEILQDTSGQVVQAETGPSIEALWGGSLFTMQHFALVRERFLGETFDMWRVKGFNSITATSHLFFQIGWEFGPEPHYAAETMDELYLGFGRGGFVQMRSLSFDRLDIQLRATIQQFLEPANDTIVYNTLIHYLRANVNITRPLSLRLIEEWNGYEEELNSSMLVAYQLNYGTAAYVGASATTNTEDMNPMERSVFAKLSYLWQPGS